MGVVAGVGDAASVVRTAAKYPGARVGGKRLRRLGRTGKERRFSWSAGLAWFGHWRRTGTAREQRGRCYGTGVRMHEQSMGRTPRCSPMDQCARWSARWLRKGEYKVERTVKLRSFDGTAMEGTYCGGRDGQDSVAVLVHGITSDRDELGLFSGLAAHLSDEGYAVVAVRVPLSRDKQCADGDFDAVRDRQ